MRVRKKVRVATIFKFLLLGIFAYVLVVLGTQHLTLYSYDQQTAQLQQKCESLTKEQQQLQQERDKLNTSDYIEKLAREELGMVKKGETVFVPGERAQSTR